METSGGRWGAELVTRGTLRGQVRVGWVAGCERVGRTDVWDGGDGEWEGVGRQVMCRAACHFRHVYLERAGANAIGPSQIVGRVSRATGGTAHDSNFAAATHCDCREGQSREVGAALFVACDRVPAILVVAT